MHAQFTFLCSCGTATASPIVYHSESCLFPFTTMLSATPVCHVCRFDTDLDAGDWCVAVAACTDCAPHLPLCDAHATVHGTQFLFAVWLSLYSKGFSANMSYDQSTLGGFVISSDAIACLIHCRPQDSNARTADTAWSRSRQPVATPRPRYRIRVFECRSVNLRPTYSQSL